MEKDIDNKPLNGKMSSDSYEQFRCKKCGRMLAQVDISRGSIRIKCYSCNTFNEVDAKRFNNKI